MVGFNVGASRVQILRDGGAQLPHETNSLIPHVHICAEVNGGGGAEKGTVEGLDEEGGTATTRFEVNIVSKDSLLSMREA